MKKLAWILIVILLCFAVEMSIAETITIPKTIIVPETFDQVPEKYKQQFYTFENDRFFEAVIGNNTRVGVWYEATPDGRLLTTYKRVEVDLDVPGFISGFYFFSDYNYSYNAEDEYYFFTKNENYEASMHYTMESELYATVVTVHETGLKYTWISESGAPVPIGYGDGVIKGKSPIDLSIYPAPTIIYEEPLILFPDVSEEKQGLVYEDGIFMYYDNGNVSTEKFGFVSFEGGSFMVANGVVAPVNGLVQDPDHPENWYFCAGGQVQSVTSLVEYDNEWFLVKDGKLDTTVSGYVGYNGGLFYIAAGKLMKQVNGLAQDPVTKEWYFCAQGQVQSEYTGLAMYDDAWFYVQNGKFDPTYHGTITYDGAEFTIVAGQPVLS